MFIGYLYIFFGEMSVQILVSFFIWVRVFFFVCLFVFNVLRGMCILGPQLGTEPTHPGVGTQES